MSEIRVQKILAQAGIASRRKAEDLIREGRVVVNGKVIQLGERADPDSDAIKVNGKRIVVGQSKRYYLLAKPQGCVSTTSDPEGRKTVFDLLPKGLRKGLFTVGRLDFHTEGLLLITNDGDFAQKVAHPRYGCVKRYEVKVKGEPTPEVIRKLANGIVLDGQRTLPAHLQPLAKRQSNKRRSTSRLPQHRRPTHAKGGHTISPPGTNTWYQMEIQEGRTRQIREMFFRMGHPVQRLRRVAIGTLRDPKLPIGSFRELTEDEVARLVSTSNNKKLPPATGGGRKKTKARSEPRSKTSGLARKPGGKKATSRSSTRPSRSPKGSG